MEPTKLPRDRRIIASSVALIAHIARLFAVRGTIISAGCCRAATGTVERFITVRLSFANRAAAISRRPGAEIAPMANL
jgi:hypothetical protein